jgi:DtxR family Mn-dependent transcriptional regulator
VGGILLSAAEINRAYRVVRVLVQDPERLIYLGTLRLYPNAAVTILRRAPFFGPLLVEVDGEYHALAHDMAEYLVVA